MAIVVLMGVSGSGKTTVGRRVAHLLDPSGEKSTFVDADWFHPEASVDKMARGIPLEDEDRWPWIDALGRGISRIEGDVVVAFSGLKELYRGRLAERCGPYSLFCLGVSSTIAAKRVANREGHYMPVTLVESQFETLEQPDSESILDASRSVDWLAGEIVRRLGR